MSVVDVLEYLDLLGVENVSDDGKEARFSCPYPVHGFGDKNPSAYMNMETTAFICFACSAQGNAITLAADIIDVPRLTAKNFIAQKWAPRYAQIDDLEAHVRQMMESQAKEMENPFAAEVYLPENTINGKNIHEVDWARSAAPWAEYMRKRLKPETLNQFGFVYDSHRDRPCITVRSPQGDLIGFKGRAWREDQDIKYLVSGDTPRTIESQGVIYGFEPYDASKHVYGAHIAQPIDGTLVLIEGEINVASAHEKGVSNAVGPSGSTLSETQIHKIADMCESLVIFFDTDNTDEKSYMTAKLKILSVVKAFEKYVNVYVVGDHVGDPNEMEAEEIHRLISEAKWGTQWRVEQGLRLSS